MSSELKLKIKRLIEEGEGQFNGPEYPYHTSDTLPLWDKEILHLLDEIILRLPEDD